MSDLTPPPVPYDTKRVADAARAADPGLPSETAQLLAAEAHEHLVAGAVDAPDVARQLLAAHREWGATAANVVARAACVAYGVEDGG